MNLACALASAIPGGLSKPKSQASLLHCLLASIAFLLFATYAVWPTEARAGNCWIGDTTVVNLGEVNSGGGATSGSVRYLCQNDGGTYSYRICIYMNPSTPPGIAPRQMVNWGVSPNAYLNYNLYSDAARTQIIGSEGSSYQPLTATTTLTSNGTFDGTVPIYASAPAGQTVAAGSYVSQITAAIRFVSQSGSTPPSAQTCPTATSGGSNYMEVRATFANTCYISAASDMDFGSVAKLASNVDATSTISLRCPTGTAWQLALNYGSNASGTIRRMAGPGGNYLTYQLYRDNARSQVWGSTTAESVSRTGTGATQTETVYGRVPAQSAGSTGTYSDTVTITLTY